MSDDMINLRAALACEYAANALRAAHTFESAAHIYGIDAAPSITSRSGDGVDNLRQAAELLGFKLTKKEALQQINNQPLAGAALAASAQGEQQ